MRELGLPQDLRHCLDDPWEFLEHQKDVFAAVVGHAAPRPDATDVAWIRLVVPEEDDINQSRWPTDPAWKVVQSAMSQDAPAEARRLIRRKQRGADEVVLDGVQFGCMISRVANRHADGGTWTLSRALRDALPDLEKVEAKKTAAGKDFGELVRERRRQRGLPLLVAEKILPFRPTAGSVSPMEAGEARVAEAFGALQAAELRCEPHRPLDRLEEAHRAEMDLLCASTSHEATS